MPDPHEGALIDGRYKVLSRIGTGGMADVYLAEDRQLGRKIALKLLHRRFAEDDAFVERFRREAQAAAGLQHPNVVSIYDRGSYEDTFYIAMEYLPGPSLREMIRPGQAMDPIRAIDIALQILKAARFAHRRGIIHRDLKPHNVMVDEAGHAKVTDFGIARAGASDMTETGSIMGTAHYLSPEQAQGRTVSPASDLYSIGVVLYEMLTGRYPFEGESAVTIALKHVSEAPPPPRTHVPDINPELEQVVLWTLNKDPAHRPQDADTLIAALEQVRAHILAGTPVTHTQSIPVVPVVEEPAAPLLPPREPTNWLPFAIAALVLLLLAGGAAAYLLTRKDTKTVPPVTGEQLNLARTQLQNQGFSVSVLQVNGAQPAGTVIGESPQGGSRVTAGSAVSLTVSQGPGATTVPTVVGLQLAQARAAIAKANLKVARVVEQPSATIARGLVTGTNPTAGSTPPAGTPVAIFVSSGKPQVSVPDVTSQASADARASLQRAGLTVKVVNQTTTASPGGTVISQDPAGGTQATMGSAVTIVVAQAPTTVGVPDVRGDTMQAAQNTLASLGFMVTQTTRKVTKANRDGIVLAQSPGPGSQQAKGSTVAVVIGRFSPPPNPSTTPTSSTPTQPTTPTTNSGANTGNT